MTMSTRKRNQLKFTKDEERVMIAFIKEHPFLWDIRHKEYKNTSKKYQAWKRMANLMGGKNVDQLKKRWRNIRDYENYKKKVDVKKTPTNKNRHDVNKVEDDSIDLSFLQRNSNEYAYKKKVDIKKATPSDKSRNDINKPEDDSIDFSFLQKSPNEYAYVYPLNYVDKIDPEVDVDPLEMEEARNDDNMNTVTTNQISATNNINKRKKQPFDDRFATIMEEHTNVLKELASSSNTLKELCRQPKSVLLQYFELYHTEIDRLPAKLRLECQREVQHAITSIIYKFQDQAEELKQSAEE